MRQVDALAVQPFLDRFADGLDLRLAAPRSTAENIRRTQSVAGEFQHRDVHGLLVLSRFHGPPNFGAKEFQVSPVQGLSENVFLHARRHKPVDALCRARSRSRTSVEETWLDDGGQQINGRFAQHDFLRTRAPPPRPSFSGGITRRSASSRNPGRLAMMKSQQIQQRLVVLPRRDFEKLVRADDEIQDDRPDARGGIVAPCRSCRKRAARRP